MKRLYILPSLALISAGVFAFTTSTSTGITEKFTNTAHLQASGGQPSLTGAPGDANCTQCHTGSVLNGNTENQMTIVDAAFQSVTSYIPGASYTVSVQMSSDPSKKGFSATALDDANNDMAGSFTGIGIGGTQDFQNAGMTRDYVSHTISSNTNATSIWSWTWVAPATNVGTVTFYVASNIANDNGSTSGDEIYLSEHSVTTSAGVNELNGDQFSFDAGYSAEGNNVTINFNSMIADDMFFNLVDMNGKSVFTSDLNKSIIGKNMHHVSLPSEIDNGMYVVNFFVGNKAMSAQVMVQK